MDPVSADVGYWLLGCGGMVAGMVSIGGLTRLTKSGLSMTDWKVQGSLPPLTSGDWEAEFERYKAFPEYRQRQGMTLGEFKVIYAWEYGHRTLGRVVGLSFVGPLLYFGARGKLAPWLTPRLGGLFCLGAAQGVVGWWMVKSGLDVKTSSAFGDETKEIRVSPYRLATHLALALTTYSGLLWTAMDVFESQSHHGGTTTTKNLKLPKVVLPSVGGLSRVLTVAPPLVVFATALSGAFVAGNDAGRAFNTFPKMTDDAWLPPDMLALTPVYRNFFENTATVQFDHRLLALASTAVVSLQLASALPKWPTLPTPARLALAATGVALTAQVSLGVATLLLYVPIPLAAAHQLGSLVLLSTTLASCHVLRRSPRLLAL